MVGLSLLTESGIGRLAEAISIANEVVPGARIMLGGRAVPEGLREVGYPFVENSLGVVSAVNTMLAEPPQAFPAIVDLLRPGFDATGLPRQEPTNRDAVAGRLAGAANEAIELARGQVRRAEVYRDLALRDSLTGIPNRRAFDDLLIARAERDESGGMLLMIDVDRFKEVNDDYGHETGDQLLRAVGGAISDSVRPGDFVGRIGGDEFVAVLPAIAEHAAVEVGDRIRAAVARNTVCPVSVSIGIAGLSSDTRATILAADAALYEAKAAGRDRVFASAAAVL